MTLVSAALAQSQKDQDGIKQPEPQISQQKERAPAQPRTEQSPVVVKIIPTAKTDTEREAEANDRQEKAETDRKLANYTGELAFFTKALFIATLVLGLATVGLFIVAIIQSRDMKASIDAAKLSAEMARVANEIMNKSAERQLQAYISVVKARVENVKVGNLPTAKFFIKNVGQTPAYNLSAETAMGYGVFPIPKGAKLSEPSSAAEISRISLGPGVRVRKRDILGHPLTQEELDNIAAKRGALYLAGTIKYTDAFERRWVNKLRLMYNWRGIQSGDPRLEVCEEGNEIELQSGPPQT